MLECVCCLFATIIYSRTYYFLCFRLFSAGINPARDMGPRLVTLFGHWGSDSMTDWLPFFIGPMIGGPSGAFLADKGLL